MNYRMILRILGTVLLILAGLMLLPLIAGLWFGERLLCFIVPILLSAFIGAVMLLFKPRTTQIFAREGFVAVGLSWLMMSAIGALPFVISGDIPNYIDALFETVSGFTTTGCTVVAEPEGMSRSVLFWRLFTHWIGGMGVLVFLMAVMPMSGEHSMHIMRAEVPGPSVGKLVPRARTTARILYMIYMGLTVLEALLLRLGGMSFYESVLNAFATAGTGGLSTRSASIASYDSLYIEMVIATFMVLFAINFNLYFLILIGRARDALKSEELHVFAVMVSAAIIAIAINIRPLYEGMGQAFRYSYFQVASIVSTTGFGTADFDAWPEFSKSILLILMLIGGCAGSTSGGLKLSRVMIVVKAAAVEIKQMLRPRSVNRVQLDCKRISDSTIKAANGYFVLYIMIILVCALIVSVDGFDPATNFSASLACMSNIGPGVSMVGPACNYAGFSLFSKIVLSFEMLLGRLEIYALAILFLPTTWKKN